MIGSDNATLTIVDRFVAGSMAGVIAQSSIYPMEVRHTPPPAHTASLATSEYRDIR